MCPPLAGNPAPYGADGAPGRTMAAGAAQSGLPAAGSWGGSPPLATPRRESGVCRKAHHPRIPSGERAEALSIWRPQAALGRLGHTLRGGPVQSSAPGFNTPGSRWGLTAPYMDMIDCMTPYGVIMGHWTGA